MDALIYFLLLFYNCIFVNANAGTSNGMTKSLLDSAGESCTAFNATLAIIRGKYPSKQKCIFVN